MRTMYFFVAEAFPLPEYVTRWTGPITAPRVVGLRSLRVALSCGLLGELPLMLRFRGGSLLLGQISLFAGCTFASRCRSTESLTFCCGIDDGAFFRSRSPSIEGRAHRWPMVYSVPRTSENVRIVREASGRCTGSGLVSVGELLLIPLDHSLASVSPLGVDGTVWQYFRALLSRYVRASL
jgi:hypothetical protein